MEFLKTGPTRLIETASAPPMLALGELSPSEERALRLAVPSSQAWTRARSLSEAARWLLAGGYERVLLLQARPGELPDETPEVLRKANPDVNLLCVCGAWCEGELRTGKPWKDVPRVYWHQLAAELQSNQVGEPRPFVLVNTAEYESAAAWIDALGEIGCAAAWSRRGRQAPLTAGVTLGVWDGAQLDGLEAAKLNAFCRGCTRIGAPVIAVFDFPRADAVEAAHRIGVAGVLGRPWSLDEVAATIERLITQCSSATTPQVVRLAA